MSFQVGDTVGDYQIIGTLGAGGMGKVYKVKNNISDRIDALKVLLPDLADDPGLADRFIREIKVLASLNHPNIAGLRTAFRLDNQLLMVMEFVEGTNLDERTKAGPIPLLEAIDYIMQALSALGYAHKNGVIHRDIKPANMMLTPDNVIKLMDFGIAKSKADKKLTQTGTTLGSLFYMSAEQVQGNELDGRSDLYSVGVSLYELVTGTRPFQGKSDFEIMVAQLQETPKAPIQMMPGLPKALNDIIMISLEKEPAKRFQTAEAFAAALRSITPSLNASAAQASSGAFAGGIPSGLNPPAASGSATDVMRTPMLPTQLTPGPPVPAGGRVSTPGGFIDTGSLPTVVAPQPEAPAALTPAPAEPSHGVPQPRASKGYRGLYMTLGALIVVAILVLGAIQVPRFLKTHAGKDQAAQATTAASVNTVAVAPNTPTADSSGQPQTAAPNSSSVSNPANTEATQATRALGVGNATPPPVGSGASPGTSSPMPSGENRTNPVGSTINTPKKAPMNHNSPNNLAPGEGPGASPTRAGGGGQVLPAEPVKSDAKAQQLEELEELHIRLAARAQAANQSVENLRRQMAATGNNLRSDVSASQSRMRIYMEKFDTAMAAGDPVAAKKNMGLAEREVENLEKFLGH